MKIYTSYYGLFRHFPQTAVPVSISVYSPDWFIGAQYSKLAPTPEILREWKALEDKDLYIEAYNEEILSKLSQVSVVNDLMMLAREYHLNEFIEEDASLKEDKDVILLCYEPIGEFCHRHLVAQWLQAAGYHCDEWSKVNDFYIQKSTPKFLF